MTRRNEMTEVNKAMLSSFLKDIKKNISLGNFRLVEGRRKNVEFLRKYGLLPEDSKDIILELTCDDYYKGPEEDRDGYEGIIYVFKNSEIIDEATLYIKIRYNPPDEVVCISLHDDEVFGR